MKKNQKKIQKQRIDADDVSKNHFKKAMDMALKACDGNMLQLSGKLGLRSRCDAWAKGQMPPYKKMQTLYFQLLDIAEEGSGDE